ncbi:MAG: ATP-binding protein [Bacteroidota bacterium]|nr:ATP-binding protein [Bacteroidota bacterium]
MESYFKISPRILEHFGVSAYTSLKKCLAELCSNAYDADAKHVAISIPKKYIKRAKIVIKDDGTGMTTEEISERYLFIGYNRRDGKSGDKSAILKRPVIGNKGIGKLAGFGVANTIKVVSTKAGVRSELTLSKEIFENIATLSEYKIEIKQSKTSARDGTELILMDLSDQLQPSEINPLREHLFKVLPNVPDFTVKVNKKPCSAADVGGTQNLIKHTIPGVGAIHGYYVVAKTRQNQPGIVIRVRKRAVTEPSLFGLEKRSHFSFSADKIIGEIEADFLDPYINTSRDDFVEEIPEVQALKTYLHDFFLGIIEEVEKTAEGKRTKQLINVSAVQDKLAGLPPHIRAQARSLIEGVISKLRNASDEEVNELVDWIIKYFDSNVLREIMKSIMAAEIEDVERLSSLISEWGLKQMSNVTEIIKAQIDIITKLEELISSNKSYEIELHKLIEGNLWLIREGLELWASDKPLKKILDGHLDMLYKKNKDERPDILCRSRDGGVEAIIMEFKRPKVVVIMDHVTQALKYKGIIAGHRPGLNFATYVIGRKYDPEVLASKDDLAKAGLNLWSFTEILQKTRARFESILAILSK